MALACAILACGLQLWHAHLRVPIADYHGDVLQTLAYVKASADHGWFLQNDQLGAPFGQEMYDFPMLDNLHYFILKILAVLLHSPFRAFNAYFLLGFPLAAVATLFVCRRVGLSFWPSLVVALLYTFMPYHLWRSQGHLLLSAYYLVPLCVLVVLGVYLNRVPVPWRQAAPGAGGRPDLLSFWLAVVVLVLNGAAGAYYCAFTCFFLVVAAVFGAWHARRWRPLLTGALLTAVSVGAAVANALPALVYQSQHGANLAVGRRLPAEAEMFGLKIAQMLLPINGAHRLGFLNWLAAAYVAPPMPLVNENATAWLGCVGAAGFLFLLVYLLRLRRAGQAPDELSALSTLNLAGLLMGTIGGFGVLFNLLVTAQIRCYNRISIFLGLFALLAVGLQLERLRRRTATPLRRTASAVVGLAVLVAGLLDQISPSLVPNYAGILAQYQRDVAFFGAVESRLPAGAAVYQLPYVPFPETWPVYGMTDYDHFRAYLHARTLRWSYGAMKGRPADQWHRDLALRPLPERLQMLALAGFSAVYVNRTGFADGAGALEPELNRLLADPQPVVSSDQTMSCFSLIPFRDALERRFSPDELQRRRDEALHPIAVAWGDGCDPAEASPEDVPRLLEPTAELTLANPSSQSRKFRLRLTLANPNGPGVGPLHATGPFGHCEVAPGGAEQFVEWQAEAPPGVLPVRLQCTFTPPGNAAAGPQPAKLRLTHLSVEELDLNGPDNSEAGEGVP
jgi:phosphoglycerol transferase